MSKTISKHQFTRLENSTFNIITALDREAKFLYSTVDTYISDAERDDRPHLVDVWNTIKQDKIKHIQMLREALTREAKEEKLS